MVQLAVNGFGRIGRLVTRLLIESITPTHPTTSTTSTTPTTPTTPLILSLVNEKHSNAATSAYLLEFDSVHGRWNGFTCTSPDEHTIEITHNPTHTVHRLRFTNEADPSQVPWEGIELVVECTGVLKTTDKLAPILATPSVQKIVVSAPMKEGVPNIVMGVNEDLYDPDKHAIVTAASCTTNCIAPVVKILHEKVGIRHGMITTVHNLTNTQCVVDTAWPGTKGKQSTIKKDGAVSPYLKLTSFSFVYSSQHGHKKKFDVPVVRG